MPQPNPLIHLPAKQGLYDPAQERDNCGVGFLAHLRGVASHQIVVDSEDLLRRMDHRGACGCEENTGDGSGILTALPHRFLRAAVKEDLGVELPEAGRFAVGNVFLPQLEDENAKCKAEVARIVQEEGQRLVGWRPTPVATEGADLGPTARAAEPVIEQLVIEAADGCEGEAFERKVYMIRKRASNQLRGDESLTQRQMFYICSLSTKVIIYKGMLTTEQLLQVLPGPGSDPDVREPPGDGALAVRNQHVPELGPRPTAAFHEPQRRNQHGPWQQANWMYARAGRA